MKPKNGHFVSWSIVVRQEVVNRIKASGDEVTMLLVDAETDKHFKDLKMVVSSDMDEGVRLVTPPRSGDDVEGINTFVYV